MDKMPPCPAEAVDAPHLIVLRYGELFLKGANRGRFEKHLQDNVRRSLRGVEGLKLSRGQGRLYVRHGDDGGAERAIDRLRRVFGLSSLSPAWEVDADLDAIQRKTLELVLAYLERAQRPGSFRIRTRRSDKQFPHNSMKINTQVGGAVVEATGLAVNLTAPELEVGIEVGPQLSFVFLERMLGAGGLPVGTSGRVGLLLSGGIDSPVAGHLMQKRGCVLHPIYFHSFPYTGDRTLAKVTDLAAALRPAQARMTLQVVPFTEIQTAIRDACPTDLAVVLYRRMMMRIGSALAQRAGCAALATGENLGQVASQTLDNLACIEQCAQLPVLRPLLTYDKVETIALARAIDTYDLSIAPYEDSCSLFVPKHPATRAKPEAAARAEEALEVEALVAAAVDATEQVDVA
jgi:thiamine biosynthesis protein ThiI